MAETTKTVVVKSPTWRDKWIGYLIILSTAIVTALFCWVAVISLGDKPDLTPLVCPGYCKKCKTVIPAIQEVIINEGNLLFSCDCSKTEVPREEKAVVKGLW